MNQPEYIVESEKTSQRRAHLELIRQKLLDQEVDLAVLSKELGLLGIMSARITDSLHVLGSSLSEQELQD